MTENGAAPPSTRAKIAASLPRRYRAERRFRLYGMGAIVLAVGALAVLLVSITAQGFSAFSIYRFNLPLRLDAALIDPGGSHDPAIIAKGKYRVLIRKALDHAFPQVHGHKQKRALYGLSTGLNAIALQHRVVRNPALIGTTIRFHGPLSDDLDLYLKGQVTPRHVIPGRGLLRARTGAGGALVFEASPGAFFAALQRVRQHRLARAALLQKRAARLLKGVNRSDPQIAASRRGKSAALVEQAGTLRRSAQAGTLELDEDDASVLLRIDDGYIKAAQLSDTALRGRALVAPQNLNTAKDWGVLVLDLPEHARRVSDQQAVWVQILLARGDLKRVFNTIFFTHADSREPELAGIAGAFAGSLLTLLATMLAAVPVGIGAAIYLEEFAPKNPLTGFIEVNINNLAAVPSIIFGLLGLAVFLNAFHLPRSAPLVGGLVLALMTLPVIIIASRAAIAAVPPSIREAALAIGASKTQTVFDHVLPLAAPGIMTGAIIGLARALGETAPLLMIGMVAFIADIPKSLTAPSTAMPVQIYLWASSAERAWQSRTAAAIIVLLVLMIVLNLGAVVLRNKFERRW